MTVNDADLELFLNFVPPDQRAKWRLPDSINRLAVSAEREMPLLHHWFAEDDEALKAHMDRIGPAYAALPELTAAHNGAMSWEAHTFLKKIDWISEDDPSNGVKLCAILLALQSKDNALAAAFQERLFRFVEAPSLSARVQLALLAHVTRRLPPYSFKSAFAGLDAAMLARFLGLVEADPAFALRILRVLPSHAQMPVWPFEHAHCAKVLELARALLPHDPEANKELLASLLRYHRRLLGADGNKLEAAAAAQLRLAVAAELAATRFRSPSRDPEVNDRIDWLLLNQGDAASEYWARALQACSRYILAGNDQPEQDRGMRRAEVAFYSLPDSMQLADALVEFEMWANDLPDATTGDFEHIYKAVAARFRAIKVATDSERHTFNSAFAPDPGHPVVDICYKAMEHWIGAMREGGSVFYLPLLAMCTCQIGDAPIAAVWDERLVAAFTEHAAQHLAESGRALSIVANNARFAGPQSRERAASLMLVLERLLPVLHAISPEQAARAIHERDRDMRDSGETLYW